jgi:MFS family permease
MTGPLEKLRSRPANPDVDGTASRNRRIFALEGLAASLVANLATAFASMFALRMGATDFQIGLISSLPPFFGLIVLLPGALATDRMKNKRSMVELSILILAISYLTVGLSPFLGSLRVWAVVIAFSLSNAPSSLYNTSWQAYFSDVVAPELRNSFYALRTKATFLTGAVVILVTGLLLAYLPRNDAGRIQLYQFFYLVAFAASFLQIRLIRRISGGDTAGPGPEVRHRLPVAMRALLQSRPFLYFAGLSLLLYVGWQMSWPLFFIAQVRYLGADEAWISLLSVSTSLLNLLVTGFWSRFIEKHGVRATLVIGILGLAVNPMIYAVATFLPSAAALPMVFVFNMLVGITFPAFQLSIFQDLLSVIGEDDKTLRIAIYSSMTLVSNILAPLFGVWMYTSLGGDQRALTLTMLTSTALRLVTAVAFAGRWRRLRSHPDVGRKSGLVVTTGSEQNEEGPVD